MPEIPVLIAPPLTPSPDKLDIAKHSTLTCSDSHRIIKYVPPKPRKDEFKIYKEHPWAKDPKLTSDK